MTEPRAVDAYSREVAFAQADTSFQSHAGRPPTVHFGAGK